MSIPERYGVFTLVIILMFLTTPFARVSAQGLDIEETSFVELEQSASRLYVNNGPNDQIRHFTYLTGPEVVSEPSGNIFEPEHVFKYGQLELSTNQSLLTENVTDLLVLPFHYNFVIDSQNQIHTTFVTNNYTVYYALRDTAGVWNVEPVNTPNEWFGWAPTIEIGANDQPRIVYAVSFKENADEYFGTSFGLTSRRSVMYSLFDGENWIHYDVGDNHGVISKAPNVFFVFYPGLEIENGTAFITFNNRLTLAAESRVYYMAIPENPSAIASDPADTFADYHHQYTIISSTISTIFTRPQLAFIGDGVVIAAGTFVFGGLYISYNNDKFEVPEDDRSLAVNQWQSMEVDQSLRSLESKSIDLIKSTDSSVIVTYSIFNRFDQINNRFTHNVLIKTFSFVLDEDLLAEGEEGLLEGSIEKITDNINVHQDYPNIIATDEGGNVTFSINYLREIEGSQVITASSFIQSAPIDDNSEFAVLAYLFVSILLLGGFFYLIQTYVTTPEKEEEILPHMINLREAISED